MEIVHGLDPTEKVTARLADSLDSDLVEIWIWEHFLLQLQNVGIVDIFFVVVLQLQDQSVRVVQQVPLGGTEIKIINND